MDAPPVAFSGAKFSDPESIHSPLWYFKQFFDDDTIAHIVHHTNLNFTQQQLQVATQVFVPTDKDEIEQLLGAFLLMGIYHNPQYRMYWGSISPLPQLSLMY